MSFVYYSGHGAADPDTKINYLIPVDVTSADDDNLWINSLNLNNIIENLREQAKLATHYVVFDACRNELNLLRKGSKVTHRQGLRAAGLYAGRDDRLCDGAGAHGVRYGQRGRTLCAGAQR